ncbi:protein piccolo [Salmo salar]|uniref:Protein piccolo n=1 Tax=Salmo salar TaxID=8030 RepID=A0ABM3DBZ3_SALSA|nr:protein piccolo-like [Salmo salar]
MEPPGPPMMKSQPLPSIVSTPVALQKENVTPAASQKPTPAPAKPQKEEIPVPAAGQKEITTPSVPQETPIPAGTPAPNADKKEETPPLGSTQNKQASPAVAEKENEEPRIVQKPVDQPIPATPKTSGAVATVQQQEKQTPATKASQQVQPQQAPMPDLETAPLKEPMTPASEKEKKNLAPGSPQKEVFPAVASQQDKTPVDKSTPTPVQHPPHQETPQQQEQQPQPLAGTPKGEPGKPQQQLPKGGASHAKSVPPPQAQPTKQESGGFFGFGGAKSQPAQSKPEDSVSGKMLGFGSSIFSSASTLITSAVQDEHRTTPPASPKVSMTPALVKETPAPGSSQKKEVSPTVVCQQDQKSVDKPTPTVVQQPPQQKTLQQQGQPPQPSAEAAKSEPDISIIEAAKAADTQNPASPVPAQKAPLENRRTSEPHKPPQQPIPGRRESSAFPATKQPPKQESGGLFGFGGPKSQSASSKPEECLLQTRQNYLLLRKQRRRKQRNPRRPISPPSVHAKVDKPPSAPPMGAASSQPAPKAGQSTCPLCKVELNKGSKDPPNYNTCTECKNTVCNLCGFNPMPHETVKEWLCLTCQMQRALGAMEPPGPPMMKSQPLPSIVSTPVALQKENVTPAASQKPTPAPAKPQKEEIPVPAAGQKEITTPSVPQETPIPAGTPAPNADKKEETPPLGSTQNKQASPAVAEKENEEPRIVQKPVDQPIPATPKTSGAVATVQQQEKQTPATKASQQVQPQQAPMPDLETAPLKEPMTPASEKEKKNLAPGSPQKEVFPAVASQQDKTPVDKSTPTPVQHPPHQETPQQQEQQPQPLAGTPKGEPGKPQQQLPKGGASHAKSVPPPQAQPTKQESGGFFGFGGAKSQPAQSKPEDSVSGKMLGFGSSIFSSASTLITSAVQDEHRTTPPASPKVSMTPALVKETPAPGSSQKKEVSPTVVCQQDQTSVDKPTPTVVQQPPQQKTLQQQGQPPQPSAEAAKSEPDISIIEAAKAADTQNPASPVPAQKAPLENRRTSEPHKPPQQPIPGRRESSAFPATKQPPKQESGGLFGFGGPKSQSASSKPEESVSGKMFGFGSSIFSSASTLITSVVQDEPRTTPPASPKISALAQTSPKMPPANETKLPAAQKAEEKKAAQPQKANIPPSVHAKVDKPPSAPPKGAASSQPAPKAGQSTCPLCKVELNKGSKDPPNYNTCTECKNTVCNLCGFNPMPHETVKEWLCLTCQMQRALGAMEPPGPPMMKSQPLPSIVSTPVALQKENVTPAASQKPTPAPAKPQKEEIPVPAAGQKEITTPSVPQETPIPAGTPAPNADKKEETPPLGSTQNKQASPAVAEKENEEPRIVQKPVDQPIPATPKTSGAVATVQQQEKQTPATKASQQVQPQQAPMPDLETAPLKEPMTPASEKEKKNLAPGSPQKEVFPAVASQQDKTPVDKSTPTPVQHPPHQETPQQQEQQPQPLAGTPKGEPGKPQQQLPKGGASHAKSVPPPQAQPTKQESGGFFGFGGAKSQPAQSKPEDSVSGKMLGFGSSIFSSASTLITSAVQDEHRTTPPASPKVSMTPALVKETPAPGSSQKKEVSPTVVCQQDQTSVDKPTPTVVQQPPQQKTLQQQGQPPQPSAEAAKSEPDISIIEAAKAADTQNPASPVPAQKAPLENRRTSEPHKPPQQPIPGRRESSAFPATKQPPKQESGGLFGFGGPKSQSASSKPEESVSGKMFGFGSSIFSSASTLITSVVQDEPRTTPPASPKISALAQTSPKMPPANETKLPAAQKAEEKKAAQPQKANIPPSVHAKVDKPPSAPPKGAASSQPAPKAGQSTCPLCKVELNKGSKDPPNYNTCTECKNTVCNLCGFNPMPHETVKEWLCLTCQMQRALGAMEPPGPPMMKSQPLPSIVSTPVALQKENVTPAASQKPTPAPAKPQKEEIPVPAAGQKEITTPSVPQETPIPAGTPAPNADKKEETPPLGSTQNKQASPAVAEKENEEPRIVQKPVDQPIPATPKTSGAVATVQQQEKQTPATKASQQVQPQQAPMPDLETAPLKEPMTPASEKEKKNLAPGSPQKEVFPAVASQQDKTPVDKSTPTPVQHPPHQETPQQQEQQPQPLAGTPKGEPGKPQQQLPKGGASHAKSVPPPQAQPTKQESGGFFGFGGAKSQPAQSKPEDSVSGKMLGFGSSIFSSASTLITSAVQDEHRTTPPASPKVSMTPALVKETPAPGSSQKKEVSPTVVCQQDQTSVDKPTPTVVQQPPQQKTLQQQGQPPQPSAEAAKSEPDISIIEAAKAADTQNPASPVPAQKAPLENRRTSEPHKPPQQPIPGRRESSAFPATKQPPSRNQEAYLALELCLHFDNLSCSGRAPHHTASFPPRYLHWPRPLPRCLLQMRQNYLLLRKQRRRKQRNPRRPISPHQYMPKWTNPPSAPPKGAASSQPAPKAGQSTCPLCKVELNKGSKDPPNYNTCTECKNTVCNLCGFNPMPHETVKEWLCLTCQMQRALGAMEPPGPPMMKSQPLPSIVSTPVALQKENVTPAASQKPTPAPAKPQKEEIPVPAAGQKEITTPSVPQETPIPAGTPAPNADKKEETPPLGSTQNKQASPAVAEKENEEPRIVQKPVDQPIPATPKTSGAVATVQQQEKQTPATKASQQVQPQQAPMPDLETAPLKEPMTPASEKEKKNLAPGSPQKEVFPAVASQQDKTPVDKSTPTPVQHPPHQETPQHQEQQPQPLAGTQKGEPGKPQQQLPKGGASHAKSVPPPQAQPTKQESGGFFGFGGAKSQPAQSKPEDSVSGKMLGFGSSIFSSASTLITSAVQDEHRTTPPASPKVSMTPALVKETPAPGSSQKKEVSPTVVCQQDQKSVDKPTPTVVQQPPQQKTLQQQGQPPQPSAEAAKSEPDISIIEAAKAADTQNPASPVPAQKAPLENRRTSEPHKPPQQPIPGRRESSAFPATKQPPKQESGGLFGFGGPKSQSASSKPEESVSGKMFGFGSSIFSSASTLITSVVQDEPRTTPPASPKISALAQTSPKMPPANETKIPAAQKAEEKKAAQPQKANIPPSVHAKVDKPPSANPKGAASSQPAPKAGQSTCPLCKVELNKGSKDPPNYNTCTECKNTVCNLCGFNPMPHETVKEWLCLTCQMQRALGAMEPPGPPMMKSQPLPSIVSTPVALQKENVTPAASQKPTPAPAKPQKEEIPVPAAGQKEITTPSVPQETPIPAGTPATNADKKEETPPLGSTQNKQASPAVAEKENEEPRIVQKPVDQPLPATPKSSGAATPVQQQEKQTPSLQQPATKPPPQIQPQPAPKPDPKTAPLKQEPGHSPQQFPKGGSSPAKPVPESHAPPAKQSGGFFGFGGTKSHPKPEDSVSGKMFGFGSSIFSSASTLITSAVQDEPLTTLPASPKVSLTAHASPKMPPANETKPPAALRSEEKKAEQPQQVKVPPSVHAKVDKPPSAPPKGAASSQPAPKAGQSTCPLCKVELNKGSKDPPNYNTCTECKNTICNLCGFNPMTHETEKEWLCLNCQTQRALSGQLGDLGKVAQPQPIKTQAQPTPLPVVATTKTEPQPFPKTQPPSQAVPLTSVPTLPTPTPALAQKELEPKMEVPKAEAPMTVAKAEAPETEVRKAEISKTEAPKMEPSVAEFPKAVLPKPVPPKSEPPKTDAAAVVAPVASVLVTEAMTPPAPLSTPVATAVAVTPATVEEKPEAEAQPTELPKPAEEKVEKQPKQQEPLYVDPQPVQTDIIKEVATPLVEKVDDALPEPQQILTEKETVKEKEKEPTAASLLADQVVAEVPSSPDSSFEADIKPEDYSDKSQDGPDIFPISQGSYTSEGELNELQTVRDVPIMDTTPDTAMPAKEEGNGAKRLLSYVPMEESSGSEPSPSPKLQRRRLSAIAVSTAASSSSEDYKDDSPTDSPPDSPDSFVNEEELIRRQIMGMMGEEEMSLSEEEEKEEKESRVEETMDAVVDNTSCKDKPLLKKGSIDDEDSPARIPSLPGSERKSIVESAELTEQITVYKKAMPMTPQRTKSMDDGVLEVESITDSLEDRSKGEGSSSVQVSSFTPGTSPTSASSLEEDSDSSPSHKRSGEGKQPRKAKHRHTGQPFPTIEDSSEEEELREEEDHLREQEKQKDLDQQQGKRISKKSKRDKDDLRAQRRRDLPLTSPCNLSSIEDASPTEEARQAREMEALHRTSVSDYFPSMESDSDAFHTETRIVVPKGQKFSTAKPLKSAEDEYEEMLQIARSPKGETEPFPEIELLYEGMAIEDYLYESLVEEPEAKHTSVPPEQPSKDPAKEPGKKGLRSPEEVYEEMMLKKKELMLIEQEFQKVQSAINTPNPEIHVTAPSSAAAESCSVGEAEGEKPMLDAGSTYVKRKKRPAPPRPSEPPKRPEVDVAKPTVPQDMTVRRALFPIPDLKITQCSSGEDETDDSIVEEYGVGVSSDITPSYESETKKSKSPLQFQSMHQQQSSSPQYDHHTFTGLSSITSHLTIDSRLNFGHNTRCGDRSNPSTNTSYNYSRCYSFSSPSPSPCLNSCLSTCLSGAPVVVQMPDLVTITSPVSPQAPLPVSAPAPTQATVVHSVPVPAAAPTPVVVPAARTPRIQRQASTKKPHLLLHLALCQSPCPRPQQSLPQSGLSNMSPPTMTTAIAIGAGLPSQPIQSVVVDIQPQVEQVRPKGGADPQVMMTPTRQGHVVIIVPNVENMSVLSQSTQDLVAYSVAITTTSTVDKGSSLMAAGPVVVSVAPFPTAPSVPAIPSSDTCIPVADTPPPPPPPTPPPPPATLPKPSVYPKKPSVSTPPSVPTTVPVSTAVTMAQATVTTTGPSPVHKTSAPPPVPPKPVSIPAGLVFSHRPGESIKPPVVPTASHTLPRTREVVPNASIAQPFTATTLPRTREPPNALYLSLTTPVEPKMSAASPRSPLSPSLAHPQRASLSKPPIRRGSIPSTMQTCPRDRTTPSEQQSPITAFSAQATVRRASVPSLRQLPPPTAAIVPVEVAAPLEGVTATARRPSMPSAMQPPHGVAEVVTISAGSEMPIQVHSVRAPIKKPYIPPTSQPQQNVSEVTTMPSEPQVPVEVSAAQAFGRRASIPDVPQQPQYVTEVMELPAEQVIPADVVSTEAMPGRASIPSEMQQPQTMGELLAMPLEAMPPTIHQSASLTEVVSTEAISRRTSIPSEMRQPQTMAEVMPLQQEIPTEAIASQVHVEATPSTMHQSPSLTEVVSTEAISRRVTIPSTMEQPQTMAEIAAMPLLQEIPTEAIASQVHIEDTPSTMHQSPSLIEVVSTEAISRRTSIPSEMQQPQTMAEVMPLQQDIPTEAIASQVHVEATLSTMHQSPSLIEVVSTEAISRRVTIPSTMQQPKPMAEVATMPLQQEIHIEAITSQVHIEASPSTIHQSPSLIEVVSTEAISRRTSIPSEMQQPQTMAEVMPLQPDIPTEAIASQVHVEATLSTMHQSPSLIEVVSTEAIYSLASKPSSMQQPQTMAEAAAMPLQQEIPSIPSAAPQPQALAEVMTLPSEYEMPTEVRTTEATTTRRTSIYSVAQQPYTVAEVTAYPSEYETPIQVVTTEAISTTRRASITMQQPLSMAQVITMPAEPNVEAYAAQVPYRRGSIPSAVQPPQAVPEVLTYSSAHETPLEFITTEAYTRRMSVPSIQEVPETVPVAPVTITRKFHHESIESQEIYGPEKVVNSLSHMYSSSISTSAQPPESLPSLVTQVVTTEVQRTTVSLVHERLPQVPASNGVAITIQPDLVKVQHSPKQNGKIYSGDAIDLRTIKVGVKMTDSGMDLTSQESSRHYICSDSSGRHTAVQPEIVNLSAEIIPSTTLSVVTDSITIVTCSDTIESYISEPAEIPLDLQRYVASMPLPLTTYKPFQPLAQIVYRRVDSPPIINTVLATDTETPINLSYGASMVNSRLPVTMAPAITNVGDMLSEPAGAVDLSTSRPLRAMVALSGKSPGVVTTVIEDDGTPIDLTAGRNVCCDVIYKLPFTGSCRTQPPVNTQPDNRFGYRDDHYQYDHAGVYGIKGLNGKAMSETNLADAGLFLYDGNTRYNYNGASDSAIDLTSANMSAGEALDYTSKAAGAYTGISTAPYSQVPAYSVFRSSDGMVYSSIAAPVPSTYAITTQPGSIFSTTLPPTTTLQEQPAPAPHPYGFIPTSDPGQQIISLDTSLPKDLLPSALADIMTGFPDLYSDQTLEAIAASLDALASSPMFPGLDDSKITQYQMEREFLELEKLKQLCLAEELEWERQEIQRYREQEQIMVQRELEELQALKQQLLMQQEEEHQAQLVAQQETYNQQRQQLEQIQQLQVQLQHQLDEHYSTTGSDNLLEKQYTGVGDNGQYWPVRDESTTSSTVTQLEGGQYVTSEGQRESGGQDQLQLSRKQPAGSNQPGDQGYGTGVVGKRIVDSGVQTDDEDSVDRMYVGRRKRNNRRGVDSSVQTDDEEDQEVDWDMPARSRRRSRSSKHSGDGKHGSSKVSSIAIQTVAEISVQTDHSGSIKRPSIQMDTKVEIIKHISAPENSQRGGSLSCQTDSDRRRQTDIIPKSPKVLYSPASTLSSSKAMEGGQKMLTTDPTKFSSSPRMLKPGQKSMSDPKSLSHTTEDRIGYHYSDSYSGHGSSSGTGKKVKRTLPNPPPEDDPLTGPSGYSTNSARRRLGRHTTMARAKILQDIDKELDLVERESSKLRRKQAELDEEEKEIDAKLRYLEMGINRRKDALLQEREKERGPTCRTEADSQYSTLASPYSHYAQYVPQTNATSHYPQQTLYQQQALYQQHPYQSQSVYSSVPSLSYPLASHSHQQAQSSGYQSKNTTNYEVIRNQPIIIVPSSSEGVGMGLGSTTAWN